jgi:hypothetical protein
MAAGSTYTPIATTTLSSSTATITFSSIPATYTDLVLIAVALQDGSATNTNGFVQLNSSTSGYSKTTLYGDGTSASSFRDTGANRMYFLGDSNATNRVFYKFDFFNYANTTTYKTTLCRSNLQAGLAGVSVYLWQNTAAINTISLTASDNTGGGGNDQFVSGSTFTLYGIAAA